MNISCRPIPAHCLPPPSGTDPIYLESLIHNAVEQMLLAHGDDGRLPYLGYIEEVEVKLNQLTGGIDMQANKQEIASFNIPIKGMERFKPPYLKNCPWPEATLTTFFRDKGQLHWQHNKGPTNTVYFVQRGDGVIRVVPAGPESNIRPILSPHLDPRVQAEVIECQVPAQEVRFYVEQPLAFIGANHPRHETRVSALGIVAERLQTKETDH
ncbi:hypothetical protein [Halomonas stenophila]|uniref:Uncharacterized protein n=1 Tax=Halomonas stenophila TaxID=795312 RepID=A0A7W5ET27_9GAMM|nr:hypothetical protein [Halomonas stenophila]MBB3230959.1 hypothetical protein [Halomonas stenophila]